jgi:hypothetical protein
MTTQEPVIYLSPGEVCERWKVEWRTMNKIPIPWVQLSPTVRRIDLAFIKHYEERNRMRPTTE